MKKIIVSAIILGAIIGIFLYGQKVAKDRFINDTNKCELGIMSNCSSLGLKYLSGYGTEKNKEKALALFEKACDGNDSEGCLNLGWIYEDPEFDGYDNIKQDKQKALILLKKACEAADNQEDCSWYRNLKKELEKQNK